uniref:Uncharacterized protein n=1 Tax=Candidatus Kentrum sp. LFY TaxID=2126342 RepID=A0A450UVX0_9GAMM|nr:MAG: hypothetical protein BECKLFY1418B_GA0070995_108813 [Candidatus Kentron sp. LFY]
MFSDMTRASEGICAGSMSPSRERLALLGKKTREASTRTNMQFLLDNRHERANVRGWSKGFSDGDVTKIHG